MPTYDYQCSTCGIRFELFQSFSEDALTRCPTKKSGNSPEGCNAPGRGKVTKVFSAPGITFKGSGFYKTDSRSSTGSGSSESSSGGSESSGSSSEAASSSSSGSSSSGSESSSTTSSSSSSSGD